eukprot:TRINITY_DN43297_c0_g1_i1.p1 TRINITY_DN43297_c0_g1~~TRINITY_DN43297_c0_g1_i1.p1  ORF type:complete len:492 (+),score=137.85 TRINITY_DN43297_c0_g1_i1:78-1478(+)
MIAAAVTLLSAAAAGAGRRGNALAFDLALERPVSLTLEEGDKVHFNLTLPQPLPHGEGLTFTLGPNTDSAQTRAGLHLTATAQGGQTLAGDLAVRFRGQDLAAGTESFTVVASKTSAGAVEASVAAHVDGGSFLHVSRAVDTQGRWWVTDAAAASPYLFRFTADPHPDPDDLHYRLRVLDGAKWDGGKPAVGTIYAGPDTRVGPNPEDHDASGWKEVDFRLAPGDTMYFAAEPDAGTALDQVCEWQQPAPLAFHYQCHDGTQCNDGDQGDCCKNHGGVARCPKEQPQMCTNVDCAGGTEHCCVATAADCSAHGGPRACSALFVFDIQSRLAPPVHPPSPDSSSGMSGGAIFLILFFCSFAVYALVGTAAQWYKGVREFPELFPHSDFWLELPELVRDGWVFAARKVLPRGAVHQSGYRAVSRDAGMDDEEQQGFARDVRSYSSGGTHSRRAPQPAVVVNDDPGKEL